MADQRPARRPRAFLRGVFLSFLRLDLFFFCARRATKGVRGVEIPGATVLLNLGGYYRLITPSSQPKRVPNPGRGASRKPAKMRRGQPEASDLCREPEAYYVKEPPLSCINPTCPIDSTLLLQVVILRYLHCDDARAFWTCRQRALGAVCVDVRTHTSIPARLVVNTPPSLVVLLVARASKARDHLAG
jgi:hypothetical protein